MAEKRRSGGGRAGARGPRPGARDPGGPSGGSRAEPGAPAAPPGSVGAGVRDERARQEAELVLAATRGERDAFEELVRRYANSVVRFARHMVGDAESAEDVAQEAMLKAYSHLSRLDDPMKFSTWLYSIARHCSLDWLRSRRPAASVEGLEEEGVEIEGPSSEPPESAETQELHGRVVDELGRLREDYREIVLLKHVYELSYKEISDMVGLSVSAVGEKLCRVRQMLRRRLEKRRAKGRD